MWLLLCLSCLQLVFSIQTADVFSGDKDHVVEPKDFWKLIFTTYYNLKGQRNETTDKTVEEFFEHKFQAYPKELYPAFEKILVHISQSNDRIWNFYESILYLYHNVDAADRIYETVLEKLLNENGKLDANSLLSMDEKMKDQSSNLEHRMGVVLEEEEPAWEEEPCTEECGIPPLQVGSIRALPGVHFPNYDDIPLTSFTCAGKHIPGFYADLETGCQVFHVCYPHRRESFLCPVGTTFNQAILACDYWYSSNCSLAPLYFHPGPLAEDEIEIKEKESIVDHLLGQYETTSTTTREPDDSPKKPGKPKSPKIKITLPNIDWTLMIKFLPIKSKIVEHPDFCETTTAYHVKSTTGPSIIEESTVATSTRPIVTQPPTVATIPPKKGKYDEKTAKSEILLNILKAVEVLTKDAEGFLSKILEKKSKHDIPREKPTVAPRYFTKKPKPFPEINPRFVVKPVKIVRHPTVSLSKPLKPSKQILKSKMEGVIRNKESAKLVLEKMKVLSHLFD